jgi:hypothetical protein
MPTFYVQKGHSLRKNTSSVNNEDSVTRYFISAAIVFF